MSLNKKIGHLLDNGFKPNFVSSLNEGTINLLYERLKNKKETKEQDKGILKVPAGSPAEKEAMDKNQSYIAYEIKEDEFYTDISGGKTQEPEDEESPDYPGSDRGKPGEQESLEEKFESKAQQGLFWARCNKCKTDNCKWCKMAKEFSKSTSKKQYKNMPKKKHPEKTVKYKKKTNEEFTFKNYFDKVASANANYLMGGLTKEETIKKEINKIIENNLKPTMKKRDLLKLIESEIQRKKGLSEDFYFDKKETEIDEDFMMGGADAPVITPKPKIKPPKPEEEEEEYDEPMNPDEGEDPHPMAPLKGNPLIAKSKKDEKDEILGKFKKRFDMDMDRLDKSTHKPHRFKKY